MARDILVQGMLGLGDNIHQRAVIRQLMEKYTVTLETPWPCIYHDLVGERLKLKSKHTNLRTQAKNARREQGRYDADVLAGQKQHRIWYSHDQIKKCGGFLHAMCENSSLPIGDFSMPVPSEWIDKARAHIGYPLKPILVYRPLVNRTEWNGCLQRNPDALAYAKLIRSIKKDYHVVSIADLEPGIEWIVSEDIGADMEFHKGELDAESIAGLMKISSLVFCSPGFALVMAQAIGVKMAAVFGGHESARLYDRSSASDLLISPINPCECFSKNHKCDKRIDINEAVKQIKSFAAKAAADTKEPAICRAVTA